LHAHTHVHPSCSTATAHTHTSREDVHTHAPAIKLALISIKSRILTAIKLPMQSINYVGGNRDSDDRLESTIIV